MNFKVTSDFEKAVKRFTKKYASFKNDYAQLLEDLKANPEMGVSLSGGFRKIRMTITSKGKGKSGGARVITYNYIVTKTVDSIILVALYDKSEQASVSETQLKKMLASI